MTVLRVVTDISAIKHCSKPITDDPEYVKQASADTFWNWTENRVEFHTNALCEASIERIGSIVQPRDLSDSRMQIVLTQSVFTTDSGSPFDRLVSVLSRNGVTAARIRGSMKLSLEAVQQALIGAVLSVNGGVASSEACQYTVSLRGLNLSILEDLGLSKRVVLIIEEADSIDKSLLSRIVSLIFSFREKHGYGSIILESNLGEPLLEEIVDDENVFAKINISKIPIIDSRELCSRVRSTCFGNLAETNLIGLPVNFPDQDYEYLRTGLPEIGISPHDLCSNILLVAQNWFRRCPLAFLVKTCMTGHDESNIRNGLVTAKGCKFDKTLAKNLSTLLSTRQTLAIVGRTLDSISAAVSGSPLPTLSSINDLCTIRFSESQLSSVIKKALTDIQSRRKQQRTVDQIIKDSISLLESLIIQIVSLGVSSDTEGIQAVERLLNRIRPLAGRTFNVTKLMDEYFTHVEKFLGELTLHAPGQCEEVLKQLTVAPTSRLESFQAEPDPFGPSLEYLRLKSVAKDSQLAELHEATKKLFSGTATTFGDYESLAKQFKDKGFDLAEALAAMELLGLIRAPGIGDLSGPAGKIRRIYKDTWIVRAQKKSEEEEEEDDLI